MSGALLLQVDLIGIVVTFNIVAVLLWFLISALRRGHRTRIMRLRITIEEIRRSRDEGDEVSAALDEVLEHLEQAEELGPLRGRTPLSAAHGAMAALVARVADDVEDGDPT